MKLLKVHYHLTTIWAKSKAGIAISIHIDVPRAGGRRPFRRSKGHLRICERARNGRCELRAPIVHNVENWKLRWSFCIDDDRGTHIDVTQVDVTRLPARGVRRACHTCAGSGGGILKEGEVYVLGHPLRHGG
ncbi:hypothetical protein AcV5_001464 [Taiwanofungus camphoratus]|nr:hypothetical protein AcV5_001464 [Antrodia cinnamomea]